MTKKNGFFKGLENIKDKNEKVLKAFSTVNRVSQTAKNESDFNYNLKYTFHRFYKDFEKFKRMVPIDSKHAESKEFCKLLSDFKNKKSITNERKNRENRILKNVNQLYNNYFDTYKKSTMMNIFDPNQFKILGKKKQKSESTKENTRREIQKPLWFEINKKEFEELTRDIYNNQYNNDFKAIINNKT